MTRQPKTYVPPREARRTSIWTALVLLAALNTVFALSSIFMTQNHAWTDGFLAKIPMPGTRTSMAVDPGLLQQIHVEDTEVRYTFLADQSTTLVAVAKVRNDSFLPVTNIVLEAHAYESGVPVRTVSALCGLGVSPRLLGRLEREELVSLLDLRPPATRPLEPGDSVPCQLAFPGLRSGADEIVFKVASVEPSPGHPAHRFRLAE